MKLNDIAKQLEGTLIGNPDCEISGVNDILLAKSGDISFILERQYFSTLKHTKASAIVTIKNLDFPNQILIKNPRKALSETILLFHNHTHHFNATTGTHFADPTAKISESAMIGHFSTIQQHTTIGHNTIIGDSCVIGPYCQIGQNCIIHPNVTVYGHVIIKDNVTIHAGSTIGSDGFGYYQKDNKWQKIPQVGTVILEDQVEIGSNSSIDRGCLGPTVIKKGSKIDNLVHIAHNCTIEENCAIAAQVGITGGSIIKKNTQIGGQVGIDAATIGENCIVAGKSGVTKNIASNQVISGFPAWSHRKELKKEAFIRRLSEKEHP